MSFFNNPTMKAKQNKPATGKSRGRSRRKKQQPFSWKRLLVVFSLLGLLLFTMGAVGYVIFFRTVLA